MSDTDATGTATCHTFYYDVRFVEADPLPLPEKQTLVSGRQ